MAYPYKAIAIVPCFNEHDSAPVVIANIKDNIEIDVLVIDDGSTDKTYEACLPLCKVLRTPINLGIGGAMQIGFKYSRINGYDFAVQVDGDGQHLAEEIANLIHSYELTKADLIIGSRFLGAHSFQSTFSRRVGIKIISTTLRILFGIKTTDPTSGFRLYGPNTIKLFAERYPSDYPEPIGIAMALQNRMQVTETPVRMRDRLHGNSSIVGLDALSYMLRVVLRLLLLKIERSVYGFTLHQP